MDPPDRELAAHGGSGDTAAGAAPALDAHAVAVGTQVRVLFDTPPSGRAPAAHAETSQARACRARKKKEEAGRRARNRRWRKAARSLSLSTPA